MYTVSDQFKERCKTNVSYDLEGKIEVLENIEEGVGENTIITGSDNLVSFTISDDCYSNDRFIGTTICKEINVQLLDIDREYKLENKEILASVGVKFNSGMPEYQYMEYEYTEYVPFGNFIILKDESKEVSGKNKFKGYDYMIKFNKKYSDNIVEYPITLKNYLISLCSQVGVELGSETLVNEDYEILGNPFTNNQDCRTVLSSIAQLCGGFAKIGRDNKLYIITLNKETSVETLEKENYNEITLNEKFGEVNSLVLRLSQAEGENTTQEDAESIAEFGRTEIVIADNPFLINSSERELVIADLFSTLNKLVYTPFKSIYYGFPWLDSGDRIIVKDYGDNENISYVFNHTFTFDGSFEGKIETESLTKTQTAYKNLVDVKSAFKNVEFKVDKINNEISTLIESQEGNIDQFTTLNQTIDNISLTVSETNANTEAQLSQLTIDKNALEYIAKRSGGDNLIKNSDMANGTNFWLAHFQTPYIESDTPPENPEENDFGTFWYCTSNFDIYKANQMYEYDFDNEIWIESDFTKKILDNQLNLMKWTSSYEDDFSRKNTISGRMIKIDMSNNLSEAESHSFNLTNNVPIKEGEEYITLSLKVKNQAILGQVYILVAFSQLVDLEYLENTDVMYEESFLLDQDECNDLTEKILTIKVPKKEDFIPVYVSATPPEDITKTWLSTDYRIPLEFSLDYMTWIPKDTTMTCYDETTYEIWAHRKLYIGYFKTGLDYRYDNIESVGAVISLYPQLDLVSGTETPTTTRKGMAWLNGNTGTIYRAKYENDVFVEWIDTEIPITFVTDNPQPAPPWPSQDMVLPLGIVEFADIKLEWNNINTMWSRHPRRNIW